MSEQLNEVPARVPDPPCPRGNYAYVSEQTCKVTRITSCEPAGFLMGDDRCQWWI